MPATEPPWDVCAFAHRVAHDLQAPLTRIRSFAGLASEDDALDEQNRRGLEIVTRSAGEASLLVERLLALTLAAERPLARRAVDVRAAIGTAREALATEFARSGAVLELGELWRTDADPELLSALCTELLANAIAFRRPGRAPRIAVDMNRPDGRSPACLRVIDDGPGVPVERRASVLEPFESGPGEDGAIRPGLGLAVCRIICQRHGWTLELHDSGGGTEVRVLLN